MTTEYDTIEYEESLRRALDSLAPFSIKPDWLQFDECPPLGRGGYAVVKRGKLRATRRPSQSNDESNEQSDIVVAVKELLPNEHKPLRLALRLAREMKIWSELNHPNILKFLGFHLNLDQARACLVSPFCTYGSLRSRLGDFNITDKTRDSWVTHIYLDSTRAILVDLEVLDVAKGLRYLHALEPPVVHGDLKADNVLLDANKTAVLCDFGLSAMIDQAFPSGLTTSRGVKGSLRWFSPELLDGGVRSAASDVWALGLTVLEILTGLIPYPYDKTEAKLVLRIVQNRPPLPNEHKISYTYYWDILAKCWDAQANRRISADLFHSQTDSAMRDFPWGLTKSDYWRGDVSCFFGGVSFTLHVEAVQADEESNIDTKHWPKSIILRDTNIRNITVDEPGKRLKSSGAAIWYFKPSPNLLWPDDGAVAYRNLCLYLLNNRAGAIVYFNVPNGPYRTGLFLFAAVNPWQVIVSLNSPTNLVLLGAIFDERSVLQWVTDPPGPFMIPTISSISPLSYSSLSLEKAIVANPLSTYHTDSSFWDLLFAGVAGDTALTGVTTSSGNNGRPIGDSSYLGTQSVASRSDLFLSDPSAVPSGGSRREVLDGKEPTIQDTVNKVDWYIPQPLAPIDDVDFLAILAKQLNPPSALGVDTFQSGGVSQSAVTTSLPYAERVQNDPPREARQQPHSGLIRRQHDRVRRDVAHPYRISGRSTPVAQDNVAGTDQQHPTSPIYMHRSQLFRPCPWTTYFLSLRT